MTPPREADEPPMDATKALTVLEGFAVDGWRGVYVLGCIDRRVTIYSQQVRALNLAAGLVVSARVRLHSELAAADEKSLSLYREDDSSKVRHRCALRGRQFG